MTRPAFGIVAVLAVLSFGHLVSGCSSDEAPDSGQVIEGSDADNATPGTAGSDRTDNAADIVIRNARIYTMDPDNPRASSLAIRGDSIVALGHDAQTAPLIRDHTRVIDAHQGMLLPGFHDAHVHPLSAGEALLGCSLGEAGSIEAILDTVEACADASSDPGEWVVGLDFNLALFPGGNPDKELLDARFADRPVYLAAADGHSAWVNSRALALAGITDQTPDPARGLIERDPVTGEASGTLRETAQALVGDLLPESTPEERVAALEASLSVMHSKGITSFIDASVGEHHWQAYRALEEAGRLQARVRTALTHGTFSSHPGSAFDEVLARRESYASEHLDTRAVKLFVDGVLEGETAALISPYKGDKAHRGELNFAPEALKDLVTRFDAMDLQVHMHAIGDRGVRAALDAVAAARERNGARDNRHHIAHLQLVHPDDIPRFAELNVSATFQALWAFPDSYITEINLPAVGQERVNRMYPLASVEKARARLVGGSDWSVSSVNPLDAIETAVRRQDPDERVEGSLNPGEAVTLDTMLAAYTRNAAWLMHNEDITGTIATGKKADLVLLVEDLFRVAPEKINTTPVRMTLFEGAVVYESP